jgi:hypothetical protein
MDKELLMSLFDEWRQNELLTPYKDKIEKIKLAITEIPDDRKENPTMKERVLKSIPYRPGRELYRSTAEARHIISEYSDK